MSQFVTAQRYDRTQTHVATGGQLTSPPIANEHQFGSLSYRTIGTAGFFLIPAAVLAYATTSSSNFQQKAVTNPSIHEWRITTSAGEIAFVRDAMKLSMTELARLLMVSRQALYDWQKGQKLSEDHAQLVAALAKATQVLIDTGVPLSPSILRRSVNGGPSLFDTIQAQGDSSSVAQDLAETLKREYQQQQLLASRLAKRKAAVFEVGQYGSPYMNERE